MNSIAQLTARTETCDELVRLGILPLAFFWHLKEDERWDVWEMEAAPEYLQNERVPAWTKEELDVMLGGDIVAPRLPFDIDTKVEIVEKKTIKTYEYIYADIDFMKAWHKSKKVINPGSQASAEMLIKALKEDWIKATEANERYNYFFKHDNS